MGMISTRLVGRGLALVAVGALLVGCTAGDPEEEGSDDTGASTDTAGPTTTFPTGPAPGVTDDSVKIGVTYVDLASLGDIVTIDHGDYESSYQALFDDINGNGGIHGRTIDPVIVPISPIGAEPADAACVQLTEDEDVFAVIGFFLDDNVLCPLETHETAVIGGVQTPERLERAAAPWFSPEGSSDFQAEVVRAMAEGGELDGALGVFASAGDEALLNDTVLPLLDELGIEPVETAINDAAADDVAATNAQTAVIAERFEAAGVDQLLVLGTAGLTWASGVESLDYRPPLRLTDPNSILAYAGDQARRDLSVLDGAVAGNLYGGPENLWTMDNMQACIETVEAGGGSVPEPDTLTEEDSDLWVAGFTACRNVVLLQALLEAAGEDLNYGSFAAGAEGLEVDVPVQPEPMTFGSGAAADGDPTAYLFDFDPDTREFVVRED